MIQKTWSVFLLCILLVSCGIPTPTSAQPNPGGVSAQATEPPSTDATGQPPSGTSIPAKDLETTPGNCADESVNQIGKSIADSYSFTSPQEVMTWFCQGAEFEDIMTALETEELTGIAAEDMLKMRAEGLSWDEIWKLIGFVQE
jgi:hypothetical protein